MSGITSADNEAAAAPKENRRLIRYIKIMLNIIVYILAIWGLYALYRQALHATHSHEVQEQTIHDAHHHDSLATESMPTHQHHQELPDVHRYKTPESNQEETSDHDHQQHPDHSHASSSHHSRISCNCGSSIAEALTLKCKYDSLAAAWLPPPCRDDELTAEFETLGPGPNGSWIYWADKAHTKEVSLTEIAAMGDDSTQRFHMSAEWHVVHCIYYWIREFRTRTNGKRVEPISDDEAHIRHCGKIFMAKNAWGTVAGVALNTDS